MGATDRVLVGRVIVEVGKPAVAIAERVVADHHDLVVVTTDEDSEDRAAIRRLFRICPCPVWVIRPTRARKLRVMAAINPDPDESDLNHLISRVGRVDGRAERW